MVVRPARVGPVQASVLDRAARSRLHLVIPGSYRERRALHSLAARGIVSPAPGLPGAWAVAEEIPRGK